MKSFIALLVVLMGAWGIALAASNDSSPANAVTISYSPDRTLTAFRSGIGVADSTDIAVLTSTTTGDFIINGKPNIDLEAVFTNITQTCVVQILWEYENNIGTSGYGTLRYTRWSSPVTLTSSAYAGPAYTNGAVTGGTGYATAAGFVFDTGGATHCRFVVTTTATNGTLSLYPGSF